VYVFTGPGLTICGRRPLSSNVALTSMLLDPESAKCFIAGYSAVLLEILRNIKVRTTSNLIGDLAKARGYFKNHPAAIDDALRTLHDRGHPIQPRVGAAIRSIQVDRWVYLRSTTRYAVFIDSKADNAYAVLGLTDPIDAITGGQSVAFEAGVVEIDGAYVCDGVVQGPVYLGPGLRRQFNASLAEMRRSGRFRTVARSAATMTRAAAGTHAVKR
jgi:hypothetical protein